MAAHKNSPSWKLLRANIIRMGLLSEAPPLLIKLITRQPLFTASIGGHRGLFLRLLRRALISSRTAPKSCRDGPNIVAYVFPTYKPLIKGVGTPWVAIVSQLNSPKIVDFCHFEPLRLDPKRPPKMMSGEPFEGLRAMNGVLLGLSLACEMKK